MEMAAVRFRPSLRLAGLILALLVVACGGEMESEPQSGSQSPTSAPATPSASPLTTTAPGPVSPLAEALAGGELLAKRPLSKRHLVYAVKEGRRVTILQRNVSTGDERSILQYDEGHEAKHSANLWEEQTPSASLSETGSLLAYIETDTVATYDFVSGTGSILLRKRDGPPFGDPTRFRWVGDRGAELCCAFGLANPVVANDTSWLAVSMTQWEGDSIGVFDVTGTTACKVDGATSLNSVWGPQGGLLIPGGGGEYATPGLFLVDRADPCSAVKIAEAPEGYFGGYSSGTWSAEGDRIVASVTEGKAEATQAQLRLMSGGGVQNIGLAIDGFNYWPSFDPTGRIIYFVRQSGPS